jgi:cbb3-type cytochrome c oxidase subunit III
LCASTSRAILGVTDTAGRELEGFALPFRTIGLVSIAFLVAIAFTGAWGQHYTLPDSLPPDVSPQLIERGDTVFHGEGLCVACHGEAVAGVLGPKLADTEWWHASGSYSSIMRQVLVGIPEEKSLSGTEMPARGGTDINESDIIAVSAYVWTLSHPKADSLPPGVTPEIVEQGKVVFTDKGDCADCHDSDATGEEGPNLTDDNWLHAKGSYLSIVNQVEKGVPLERSKTGIFMPPRGGSSISDADVNAVAAYVWAISRQSN